jgi:hypothetical protein
MLGEFLVLVPRLISSAFFDEAWRGNWDRQAADPRLDRHTNEFISLYTLCIHNVATIRVFKK